MKITELASIQHKDIKYVVLSLKTDMVLCDPTDWFDVQEIAKEYAKEYGSDNIEIAEFTETWKPAIDYSVLDMY